ncbi:MAG: DUF3667 domain-containing protein [Alphaproteobacteria bacterium]|nr:MAG: DUF3667 domain-containing protein [Alphaproteobacteria bacterium]
MKSPSFPVRSRRLDWVREAQAREGRAITSGNTTGKDVPDLTVTEGDVAVARCANCAAVLHGDFCAHCGQRDADLRRPIRVFVAEFLDNALSFDSRALRTLVLLFGKPGRLSELYVEGARVRFVPPVRLLLISVIVFFLAIETTDVALLHLRTVLTSNSSSQGEERAGAGPADVATEVPRRRQGFNVKFDFFVPLRDARQDQALLDEALARFRDALDEEERASPEVKSLRTPLEQLMSGLRRLAANPGMLNSVFHTWLPRVMFLLVPVFALVLRGLHWSRRRFLFENLVFSLHFHAFLFCLLTLLVLLSAAGYGGASGMLYFVGKPLYLVLAMKRFYGR